MSGTIHEYEPGSREAELIASIHGVLANATPEERALWEDYTDEVLLWLSERLDQEFTGQQVATMLRERWDSFIERRRNVL